jgi:hypothetical protein
MSMPQNRDQLIDKLSERIRRFNESGDPAVLLDPEVPGLARDLAETLWSPTYLDVTPDVTKALIALVGVHWIRSQLLPGEQGQDDLQACRRWSGILIHTAPDLVPEPVRAYLGRS